MKIPTGNTVGLATGAILCRRKTEGHGVFGIHLFGCGQVELPVGVVIVTDMGNIIIVVMGVSGSGKSTYGLRVAQRLELPFVEGDAYHPPANVVKMADGVALDDADREPWLERLAEVLAEAEQEQGCVLACSALKASYRDILGRGLSAKPTYVYLEGAAELLRERLGQRIGHFFPLGLLDSQLETLEKPEDAIVIDIAAPIEEGVDEIVSAIRH